MKDFYLWENFKNSVIPLDGKKSRPSSYSGPRMKNFDTYSFSKTDVEIDFHGYTVQQAYERFKSIIYECYDNEITKCYFVTGKSGRIKHEFEFWINQLNRYIKKYDEVRDGGAYIIYLKKK